jgi:glycosyltransferase involved in cell wall biosynthesis
MRILYLNPDNGIPVLGGKGASVHVREFVTAAAGLGHEIVLACSRLGEGNAPPAARLLELAPDASPSALQVECAALGLPVGTLDEPLPRREVARLAHDRALPARLRGALAGMNFRPDLIFERQALFYRAGAVLATQLGIPRLLEVNAPLVEEQRRFRGLMLADVARRFEAESYRGADAIIAVSAEIGRHVRAVLGHSDTLHVVPNGVDVARFGAGSGGAAIRARLGIGTAPVIGFVGSFKPWHGALFLLDMFRDLAAVRPDARLLAVGEGPALGEFRARAGELGLADRLAAPGHVPHAEIPAWFAAMDLTIAPYLPQPDFYFSPLKVVESLAAGRPVVAPRTGQLVEMIEDGETGLLYPPGDHAACLGAVLLLLEAPARRRAMGEAARQRAAGLGWRQVATRVLDLAAPSRTRESA